MSWIRHLWSESESRLEWRKYHHRIVSSKSEWVRNSCIHKRPNTREDRDAGDDNCKHSRRDGRFYVSYSAEHLAIIHDEHLSREGGWDWGRNSPTFTSCCFFSLATVSKSTSGSGFCKREMTQTWENLTVCDNEKTRNFAKWAQLVFHLTLSTECYSDRYWILTDIHLQQTSLYEVTQSR